MFTLDVLKFMVAGSIRNYVFLDSLLKQFNKKLQLKHLGTLPAELHRNIFCLIAENITANIKNKMEL